MPSLKKCFNIADLRQQAQKNLPLGVWEYLERGVEDEAGMARNRAGFDKVTFRPRVLRNVEEIDLSTEILGQKSSMPLAIAPTGAAGLNWYRGDVALARAARSCGVPFTISTASTIDLGEIAEAGGSLWFQLYLWENRELSMKVVDRAWENGCTSLFVTLDLPTTPNREYIKRNGFGTPFRLNARNTLDILAHPKWLLGVMGRYYLTGGIPTQANLPAQLTSKVTESVPPGAGFKQDNLDWDGIRELRDRWPGKLILKGMMHPEDARRAVEAGADGIVVSNHGGRSMDASMATMDALPAIVDAVGGKLTILIDSGVRRGTDVVRALTLGADAVLTGRAPLYGLATAGQAGVEHALEILRSEIKTTMAMLGARSVKELDHSLLG